MRTALVLSITLLMQGCVARMIEMANSPEMHKQYSAYVAQTQQVNIEREKAHLAPVTVMTFDEWNGRK